VGKIQSAGEHFPRSGSVHLDICTLSYLGIKCQIEFTQIGILKLKKGESGVPDSPISV
jgi:hypothetical protein